MITNSKTKTIQSNIFINCVICSSGVVKPIGDGLHFASFLDTKLIFVSILPFLCMICIILSRRFRISTFEQSFLTLWFPPASLQRSSHDNTNICFLSLNICMRSTNNSVPSNFSASLIACTFSLVTFKRTHKAHLKKKYNLLSNTLHC